MNNDIEYKGYTIKIVSDDDPESPREWDNLGTMVCFHNRYALGDKHDYDADMFSGWDEIEQFIKAREDVAVILPLSLYDHSGITMSVGRSSGWDCGQVGFIFVSKAKVRKEYSVKRISPKLRARIEKYLRQEVETYDTYLRGDVVGFRVVNRMEEETDSCYGFYDEKDAIAEAKGIIDWNVEHEWKEIGKKTIAYIKARVPLEYRHTEVRFV